MSRPAIDVRDSGEAVESFRALGVEAFTTGRAAGNFSTASDEPASAVMARWSALREAVGGDRGRLATAKQVHGAAIVVHSGAWRGWLRGPDADGHIAPARGTALAVSVADCVPVFLAHPHGLTAVLHSGWRGTAARITELAIREFLTLGLAASDLHLHCGPAICGKCYEVSPDVYERLTGRRVHVPTTVDLRALITEQARALGVVNISVSARCTKCDNDRFFSHRAGDSGRQIAVIYAAEQRSDGKSSSEDQYPVSGTR